MNTNNEIALREARIVKNNIDKFLDSFQPRESNEAIKAVYETAIASIDRFKDQFPSEFKLLRDVVIPKPFPDGTNFPQSAVKDKVEKKSNNAYLPGSADTLTYLRKNIVVINNKVPFYDSVKEQLIQLEATSVGKRLIDKIDKLSHTVFIREGDDDDSWPQNDRKACKKGVGTSSTITLTGKVCRYFSSDFTEVQHPSFFVLAHELIHAYHAMQGKMFPEDPHIDKLIWGCEEEYYTIMGFPSKNPLRTIPKISENALLKELGLPMRITHRDTSNMDAMLYARLKLAARLFDEASKSFTPRQKICPPIVRIKYKELEPSTFVVRIFKSMDYSIYPKANECAQTFVWKHIFAIDCTPELCGPYYTDKLQWVSDYRLNLLEAAYVDRALNRPKRKRTLDSDEN